MRRLRLRDDDGEWVQAGDVVRFTYGIPPLVAEAKVVQRAGQLIALTPEHNPLNEGSNEACCSTRNGGDA